MRAKINFLAGGVVVGIGMVLLVIALTNIAPPDRDKEHERVIDSLQNRLDSLQSKQLDVILDRHRLLYKIEQDSMDAAERDRQKQTKIHHLEQTIRHGAKTIHSLPTAGLDSIVTAMYGTRFR